MFAELQLSGMVARSRDPADGRGYLLSLAAAGRAALRADMRHRDRWLRRALTDLSHEEIEILVAAGAILERLAEHEEPDSPRRTA